ncbi:MAG TPA: hypothetical protein VL418_10385 [Devosiaceae bacterium]|jgi:hypothetical protein|nr:hypothetical protein [Devosiaceae bacterium]
MNRSGLYRLIIVLGAALVGISIYAYQQSQRPAVQVQVDGNGLKINGTGG